MATVPKSTMQGKTMVSATGGSPQIIQTHSGSQMTTTMAGAGGNNNLNLLFYRTFQFRYCEKATKFEIFFQNFDIYY